MYQGSLLWELYGKKLQTVLFWLYVYIFWIRFLYLIHVIYL